MKPSMTRRDFFRWAGSALFGAALPVLPVYRWGGSGSLARVTRAQVNIHREADARSDIVARKKRDELLHVYFPVNTKSGTNSLWYRTWGGYVHSAYLQAVSVRLNAILDRIPRHGCPVEVTVPFTQSMRYRPFGGWEPIYRLYCGSVHWIDGVIEGPDGTAWYQLVDSYERVYYAPGEHFRAITADEITPLSCEVPPAEKKIVVSISEQRLTAFEGDDVVLDTRISSGLVQKGEVLPGEYSSETPIGNFRISVKAFFRHMGGTQMIDDLTYGAYPGVPWVGFFHQDGYSFHGTYWHHNFGVRMSSGCVNMRTDQALWLFRWSDPAISLEEREVHNPGTLVQVTA